LRQACVGLQYLRWCLPATLLGGLQCLCRAVQPILMQYHLSAILGANGIEGQPGFHRFDELGQGWAKGFKQPGTDSVLREQQPTTEPIPVRGIHPKPRSEEHTSELQSRENLVCRLLLEK